MCSPCFAPGNSRVAPLAAPDAPDSTRHCVRGPRRPSPPAHGRRHTYLAHQRDLNTLGYSSVVHGAARATFLFIRPPSPRRARHAVPRPRLRLARGERFTVTLRAPPSAGLMLRCPPWPSLPRAARPEIHLICAPALPGASRHLHLPPATTPRLELVEGTVRQRLTGSADAGSAAGASIVRISLSKLKRPNRWF